MTDSFKALLLEQRLNVQTAEIRQLEDSALPPGDVTVAVEYSSLNYKDGLAVTGTGKIIRQFPMVAGIDLAGTVLQSADGRYKDGDHVLLTGWGIGERTWGGYTQKNRVKADWLVPLPDGLTTRQAMSIGTAGFTAMLCVMALEQQGVKPGADVVVTGAAGGVGSISVAVLAKLGYRVTASTGRYETHDYLRSLGAVEIIDRSMFNKPSGKPMDPERWHGAVDSVGGATLATLIRSMKYGGSIAACGLAGGADVSTTVFPFILRAVNLLGVDSVYCPPPKRREAWRRLVVDLPLNKLEQMTRVISLGEVERFSRDILAGQVQGRIVVDVNA
jgi:acrylyl-CoA reductase (NADPH)